MILATTLGKSAGIRHGFFTREGGTSSGLYASLNCGPGSDDDPEFVTRNRARAMKALEVEPERLCTVYQVHGTEVAVTDGPWPDGNRPKADALVTRTANLAIGILTADCAPVLMADHANGVIAAVHCGWKGALGGVAEAALEAMTTLGADRGQIIAAVGPCIAQNSYEVGPEFFDTFARDDEANEDFFVPSPKDEHWQFDLRGFVGQRLSNAGVTIVELLRRDTCAEKTKFFSYRRATQRDEPDYGRQLSAIVLGG